MFGSVKWFSKRLCGDFTSERSLRNYDICLHFSIVQSAFFVMTKPDWYNWLYSQNGNQCNLSATACSWHIHPFSVKKSYKPIFFKTKLLCLLVVQHILIPQLTIHCMLCLAHSERYIAYETHLNHTLTPCLGRWYAQLQRFTYCACWVHVLKYRVSYSFLTFMQRVKLQRCRIACSKEK